MRQIKDQDFAVIDVETTGLSPYYGDRVIEVAAVRMKSFKITKRFQTLINPERPLSYNAFLVNGITEEMVSDAPRASEVLEDVRAVTEGACLIGHNVKFDLKFLNHELELAGQKALDDEMVIDTVKMSRGLLPELGRHSLANVARYLGVAEDQQHRAMSDVMLTLGVFKELCSIAREKDIRYVKDCLRLFGIRKPKMRKRVKVDLIRDVIGFNGTLHLLYQGRASGATLRKVTPKKVEGAGRNTTLVGYCHLRKAERSFLIERIVHMEKFGE